MAENNSSPDILKRMSSVVSHELRNPLAIISNSLYFIKTKLGAAGAALDPKIAKHIGIIEGEVKHSNEVIEQMLAYTRTRELSRAPAGLNAAVNNLQGSYPVPENIKLEVKTDPADPAVNADMEAVGYALRAALSNAVLALPEGGSVTVQASSDGKNGCLTVSDSGPGLPAGDGEKVFEPFFTTRPRGIGLGLTLARKYMELHGGTAKAENLPGGGARVTLTLPLHK